jgi:hypothetical protein
MASEAYVKSFTNLYADYKNINLEYFYLEFLGELNLKKELESIIVNIKQKLDLFNEIKENLPDDLLIEITAIFSGFKSWAFDTERNSREWFANNRAKIVLEFQKFAGRLSDVWQKSSAYYLEYLATKLYGTYISDLRKNLNEQFLELKQKTEGDAKRIEELKILLENQTRNIDERITPIIQKGEILAQEKIFFDAARKNKRDSYYWIGAIILLTTCLLILFISIAKMCVDFSCFADNLTSIKATQTERHNLFFYYIIKKVLANLLIISLLIYLLKFGISNYNAIMHNRTVNLHKANAFAASLNLIGNVKDATKQDEIINLAAKEIFTQQKTGYLHKDGNDINISVLEKLSGVLK